MLLAFHITGGLLSAVAAGAGIYALARRQEQTRWIIVSLPLLAGTQIVSGFLLLWQGASLLRMCTSGLIYLSLMAWLEYRLWQRRCEVRKNRITTNNMVTKT